jgi:hypothetical protein
MMREADIPSSPWISRLWAPRTWGPTTTRWPPPARPGPLDPSTEWGQVDQVLGLSSEGGATVKERMALRFESWRQVWRKAFPAARFASAWKPCNPTRVGHPRYASLSCRGVATSEQAVELHFDQFTRFLPGIPAGKRRRCLCLVRDCPRLRSGRAQHRALPEFVVTAFGDTARPSRWIKRPRPACWAWSICTRAVRRENHQHSDQAAQRRSGRPQQSSSSMSSSSARRQKRGEAEPGAKQAPCSPSESIIHTLFLPETPAERLINLAKVNSASSEQDNLEV